MVVTERKILRRGGGKTTTSDVAACSYSFKIFMKRRVLWSSTDKIWRRGITYTFKTGSRLEESSACRAHQGGLELWTPPTPLNYPHEAEWTPFQNHYFSENLVAPGIEPGSSGSVARNSDYTTEVILPGKTGRPNAQG
jgi:hypothetical protein